MKKQLLSSILLSLAAGVAIGLYGGFTLGKAPILNNALQKDAREIQAHLLTLKHLQAGETDKAIEAVESCLDDDLILFDPWEPYKQVTERTKEEISKAIQQTRDYRAEYPRKSNRPHVDKMVGNVLNR